MTKAKNLNQTQGNAYREALRLAEIELGRFLRHAERVALQNRIAETVK